MAANSLIRLVAAPLALTLAACAAQPAPKPAVATAASTPCPTWTDEPADPHSNANSLYLGCANRANLDAMVVDKHDLIVGRKLGPADGERELSAVEDYKQGKIKLPESGGTTAGVAVPLPGASQGGTQ